MLTDRVRVNIKNFGACPRSTGREVGSPCSSTHAGHSHRILYAHTFLCGSLRRRSANQFWGFPSLPGGRGRLPCHSSRTPAAAICRREGKMMLNETRGWTSVAAWGDWHPDVAAGKVCVYATQDGRLGVGGKYFILPCAEYVPGLAIDPRRHTEATGFVPMTGSLRVVRSRATGAGPSEAMDRPGAFRSGAVPWKDVIREIERAESGGGSSEVMDRPAASRSGALPWKDFIREIERAESGGGR